ncbi:leukocyte immunoglobulin-like receptor subfamily A member 5 [Gracilinanus agilis]|uniref:leukocyte immunoglobulin-like receptor subfamily A member 5 n=1 Tax=Gracilinanus agilis TaxID=191870 RepID=UPI001CFD0F2B|nr:leukocyte immunoglobulin-like receptor subfamily A member 5 [Gracilinanus agilis]
MPGSLAALLCLGLCLSQSVKAYKERLPKPALWAVPGPVIPWGKPTIIRCQGTEDANKYVLEKDGGIELRDMLEVAGPWKEAEFFISNTRAESGGQYRCQYSSKNVWSEFSDPLELTVTGLYPKPSFSIIPVSILDPGEDVTFHCESQMASDKFIFYKTTGANAPHMLSSSDHGADFPIPSVTASHGGTYQCYTFDDDYPYLWSIPSDIILLKVSDSQRRGSSDIDSDYDSVPQQLTFTSLRLVIVGVTLAILGILLNEVWHNRAATYNQDEKPKQPERQSELWMDGPIEDSPKRS